MSTKTNTVAAVSTDIVEETVKGIAISDVTFARTVTIAITFSENDLAAFNAVFSNDPDVIVGEPEFKTMNKGHQIVAIFKGIHSGDIEFGERKEIAKAVNASPAMVSTIFANALKANTDWAVSYNEKDKEIGEIAAAKRKIAEMEALLAKHPELAEMLAARLSAESAA